MFRASQRGERIDDAETIWGARAIVRGQPPGRYDADEIRAKPFTSGHTSRQWGRMIRHQGRCMILPRFYHHSQSTHAAPPVRRTSRKSIIRRDLRPVCPAGFELQPLAPECRGVAWALHRGCVGIPWQPFPRIGLSWSAHWGCRGLTSQSLPILGLDEGGSAAAPPRRRS
jgi:hypothetical protein